MGQTARKISKYRLTLDEEIDLNTTPGARLKMTQRSNGRNSVPQIFIGTTHVGGCEELYALENKAQLDQLLSTQG